MSASSGEHLVFTYGTLKRNEPNYPLIAKLLDDGSARFIGLAQTSKLYPLVVATVYNVPWLLDNEGVGYQVHGEIYQVNDSGLALLDQLENHPVLYTRDQVDTIRLADEGDTPLGTPETVRCWAYLLKDFNKDLLKLKLLESYSDKSADSPGPYTKKNDIPGKIAVVKESS